MNRHLLVTLSMTILLSAGLANAKTPTLTVISHDSFSIDKKLIRQFEQQTGAKLRFVKGGDAGELLNRLILTRRRPLADVVYGLDNSMLSRANKMQLLQSYVPSALKQVSPQYRLSGNTLSSTNYGYIALNYERAYFDKHKLSLPSSLDALAEAKYAKLTVVESPATSSTGLGFLLATVNHFGEEKAWQWWRKARKNGMRITRGWSDAYYKDFSKNGGKYPIVLSYGSSPAAEVFYSKGFDPKNLPATSPTANLFLEGSSYLQIEGVGILRGSKQGALAKRFVDFMLSPAVQNSIPTSLWVYPAVTGTQLDGVFKFAQKPQPKPIAKRYLNDPQRLIDSWIKQVLRAR